MVGNTLDDAAGAGDLVVIEPEDVVEGDALVSHLRDGQLDVEPLAEANRPGEVRLALARRPADAVDIDAPGVQVAPLREAILERSGASVE